MTDHPIPDENQAVTAVVRAMRNTSFYTFDHPVVKNNVWSAAETISAILERRPAFVLKIVEGEVVADDSPLFHLGTGTASLVGACLRRDIESISFRRGLRAEEVGALISVLATDPEELRRHDGAAASLRRAGAGNIVIDRLHDSSASSPDRRPADAIETIYATAVDVLRYASRQAHTDIPVEMESVSKVVSDLVDAIILDQGTALGLVAIKGRDEYTFTHTLHTCILCLELGYAMGLSRDDLRSLGSCGLLHDIGKVFVPLSILRKSSPLDPDEFATIQEHPVHGALVLSRQDSAPSVAPLVAFEHHLHCDFSGYPVISRPRALNFYSLMVGLADVYDAMTTDRPYRAAMTPQQALEAMYQQAGHFEPRLLDAFAAMLGEYPVGSLLRLSDGRLAVVTHPHASHVSRPLVRIVEREEGVARLADDETDLSALDPSGRGFLLNVDSPADPESEGIDVCVLLGGNPYFAE